MLSSGIIYGTVNIAAKWFLFRQSGNSAYASILCSYYFEEYRQYKIKGQIARLFLIQLVFNTFRS